VKKERNADFDDIFKTVVTNTVALGVKLKKVLLIFSVNVGESNSKINIGS
jgi:hypothetical protein